MAKILLVEDDLALAENLRRWLPDEHHIVEVIASGKEAADHLKFYQYDAIVLDWMLPEVTGVELCKRYRAAGGTAAIIMLTGKKALEDKETGLDAGADDYLTKPFHPKELSARLRALFRRGPLIANQTLQCGPISIDPARHQVFKDGEEVRLLPKEYALLEFLMKHQDQVFSPEALLDRIWPTSSDVSPESIRSYVARLRSRIDTEGKPSIVQNVHGVGYKVSQPD